MKEHRKKSIDDVIYKNVQDNIDTRLRYSCYDAFHMSEFYQELTPKLQQKLVNDRLKKLSIRFREFFMDHDSRDICSNFFIQRILTVLHCELWPIGYRLVEQD